MKTRRNHFLLVVSILTAFAASLLLGAATTGAQSGNPNETDTVVSLAESAADENPSNDADAGEIPDLRGSGSNPNEVNVQEAFEASAPDDFDAPAATLTKVILIPPAAWTSDGFDPDGYLKSFAGGYFTSLVEGFRACLTAPVIFPEGASRIVSVFVFAHDNNPSSSERFDFYRISLPTGTTEKLGAVSTADSAGVEAYRIPVSGKHLTNATAYQIATCAGQDIRVYGAKVTYQ